MGLFHIMSSSISPLFTQPPFLPHSTPTSLFQSIWKPVNTEGRQEGGKGSLFAGEIRKIPDMMAAWGSWKSGRSKGGCINFSDPNADNGEGVKNSENFADIICESSLRRRIN